jgi:non-specific serine/threonine protein kinase
LAWAQEDLEPAGKLAEASLPLWRTLADQSGEARSLNLLAMVAHSAGDYDRAAALYEAALSLRRALGQRAEVANLLSNLGGVEYFRGDLDRAATLLGDAIAFSREIGDSFDLAGALFFLAGTTRIRGDLAGAAALYQEGLTLMWQLRAKRFVAESLRGLVGVAAASGLAGSAARLAGAETVRREAIGTPVTPPAELERYERDVAAARDAMGEGPFAAALAAGQELPLEQAVAEALTIIPGPATGTDRGEAYPARAPHGLSPREVEVLRLIAQGLSDRQIAETLYVSRRTVSTHVSNILNKIGVPSRSAAAAAAGRYGLI